MTLAMVNIQSLQPAIAPVISIPVLFSALYLSANTPTQTPPLTTSSALLSFVLSPDLVKHKHCLIYREVRYICIYKIYICFTTHMVVVFPAPLCPKNDVIWSL